VPTYRLDPAEFLKKSGELIIFDTRSPGEFEKGHIAGALNLPLFNNEERAEVGTLYKQSGKDAALMRGLDIVGPKMTSFIKQVKAATDKKEILIHCWRGGMRSSSMAWLLETAGYTVYLLEGGYKAYRNFIRKDFERKAENLVILGGMTGTGKTDILIELEKLGQQIIDLEGIANHRGSAFGTIGMDDQPTNEQFENDLYNKWSMLDISKTIWVEDESKKIGRVEIVEPFFQQMRNTVVVRINLPKEVRVKRLVRDYCAVDMDELINPVKRISRRLGGLREREIIEHIENCEFDQAVSKVLDYYDRGYSHGNSKRDQSKIHDISFHRDAPSAEASELIDFLKNIEKSGK